MASSEGALNDGDRAALKALHAEKVVGMPKMPEPVPIGVCVAPVVSRMLSRAPLTPEQRDEIQKRRAEAQMAEAERRKVSRWENILARFGERYRDCTLESFRVSPDPDTAAKQRFAVRVLQAFIEEIDDRNVILFGTPGTGKDHMLTALMRRACADGRRLAWINGVDLFGRLRDAMDDQSSELGLIRQWTEPDILCISDPVPPFGDLSSFQSGLLFQILDRRYRDLRATWVTMNVASGDEADARMGKQVADRLRHGAIALHFDWPSFRETD